MLLLASANPSSLSVKLELPTMASVTPPLAMWYIVTLQVSNTKDEADDRLYGPA